MKKIIIAMVLALITVGVVVSYKNEVVLNRDLLDFFSYRYLLITLLFLIIAIIFIFFGINLYLFFLFMEIVLSGFFACSFITSFGLNGFYYFLFYLLISKALFWFMLILLIFYTFKIQKNIVKKIFLKSLNSLNNIKLYFKKILIVSTFYAGYLFFLCLVGSKILILLGKSLLF